MAIWFLCIVPTLLCSLEFFWTFSYSEFLCYTIDEIGAIFMLKMLLILFWVKFPIGHYGLFYIKICNHSLNTSLVEGMRCIMYLMEATVLQSITYTQSQTARNRLFILSSFFIVGDSATDNKSRKGARFKFPSR